jgi:hypothetical protein
MLDQVSTNINYEWQQVMSSDFRLYETKIYKIFMYEWDRLRN